jgi:hypothetical protein
MKFHLKVMVFILSINMLVACNYNIGPREIVEESEDKPEEKPIKNIKNTRIFWRRLLLNGEIYKLLMYDVIKLTTLEKDGKFIDIGMRFYEYIALDSNGKIWTTLGDELYTPMEEFADSIFISKRSKEHYSRLLGPKKLILITPDSRIFVEEEVYIDNSYIDYYVDYYNIPLKSVGYNKTSLCGKDADSYLSCWNFPLDGLPSFRSEEKVTDILISEYYLCYLKETGFVSCHSIAENGKIDYREFSLNNQQEPLTQITFRKPHGEGMVRILGLTESGDIKFWDRNYEQPTFVSQGKSMIRIEEYPENFWFYSVDENGTLFINDHIYGESEPLELDIVGASSGVE